MGGNPNPTPLSPSSSSSSSPSSLPAKKKKKKLIVIMGATGSGKSRLAIDLASHLAGVEVINADSMQVYRGLDVITNKVPLSERNGIPHHLLGNIDGSMEFTSRDFRDMAIPIIDDILSRNGLPVIVGGTNYYIQALVSPFLVDDVVEDMEDGRVVGTPDVSNVELTASYERLKEIDPVAANRIHPNDHRKINHYLSLYASSGVLPSILFQGKAAQNWGQADSFRYDCCFIWLDVSLPILDRYVNQRVDSMIENGLLLEVYDVYKPDADYTRGLRQAIGIREFEEFFKECFLSMETSGVSLFEGIDRGPTFVESVRSIDCKLGCLLTEAIDKLKANTRKLVRRQVRRLKRLKTYFGWNLHHVNATEAFLCDSGNSWHLKVVGPCVAIVNRFLSEETELTDVLGGTKFSRDLWSQYVCEACGNRILRGAHEWEQHKQGRGHRKRVLGLRKKSQLLSSSDK